MARQSWKCIPQVITIAQVGRTGHLALKSAVRKHLRLGDQTLRLDLGDEAILTTRDSPGAAEVGRGKRSVRLPPAALARLGLEAGSLVATVQREDAVALKRVSIEEREGDLARIVDIETPLSLTRVAYTNPWPESLLPRLKQRYHDARLTYEVRSFLAGETTLQAWTSRRLLGWQEPTDDALRDSLVRERLAAQAEDGSWEGEVTITARNLRELAELGLGRGDEPIRRGLGWLLARSESPYNPGMFFLSDDLAARQVAVVEERQRARREGIRGPKARFRELRTAEKRLVMAGDDIIRTPCGPRLMWPNALVLEALLAAGYEDDPRVQRALTTMTTHDWCECGYQHGLGDWRRGEPFTDDDLVRFEATCIGQYRYGAMAAIDRLLNADQSHPMDFIPRVARRRADGADEYLLRMDEHLQGCEVVTTRAMSRARDERVRRFAAAHLWRFAGRQLAPNGQFAKERYGGGMGQAGLLQVFARFDHPASRVVIMRSIPWIIEAQNPDGSWGEEGHRDKETLGVIEALLRVRDLLQARFIGQEDWPLRRSGIPWLRTRR